MMNSGNIFTSTMQRDMDYESTIRDLNSERIKDLVPVIVYLGILSFTGMVGNGFVLYLFLSKFKKSTSAPFIVWLATLDFIVCAVGIPFEIIDILFSYTFFSEAPCRIFRFTLFSIVYASALTLIVIAIDRFVKVCYALKRWNIKPHRTLLVCTAVGFVCAIPVALVFGRATIRTRNENVNGTECSISDEMALTPWPKVYYATLALIFIVSIFSIIVLYGKLVHTLFQRKRQMSKEADTYRIRNNADYTEGTRETGVKSAQLSVDEQEPHRKTSDSPSAIRVERRKQLKRIIRLRRRSNVLNYPGYFNVPTERTSLIFACVSLSFVISYVPSLLIVSLRESSLFDNFGDDYLLAHRASDLAYNLFIRSYFLNHTINPIIYGFLNPSFRRECCRLVCPCRKFKIKEAGEAPIDSISSSVMGNVL